MTRKVIIGILVALVLVGTTLLGMTILNQWRRMRTMDSMGQLWVAMCETLSTNNFKQIDVATEALKLFPEIPVKNGQVLDSWGQPLKVSIERIDEGFRLDIISSGRDRVMGTSDDIIWKRTVRGDNPTPKKP